MILSATAKLAGVMGWPVEHSRSPRLHGFWLERYSIDGAYVPLPVRPEAFPTAIRSLGDLGFRGVNLTLPHKEAALSLCDTLDPLARRIGAVNTVVFGDGALEGRNTDVFGFLENLREGAPGRDPKAGPAVVLGAGGAARAVVAALAGAGVAEIRVANRTPGRAETLAESLNTPLTIVPWPGRAAALAGAALLVNATSLGMTGQPTLDLVLDELPTFALVTDLVYTPLETSLLRRARARGNQVIDGLGMLLYQARPGFEAWFGVRPEITAELRTFVLAD